MSTLNLTVLSYMKRQVPTFSLATWTLLNKYAFDETVCNKTIKILIPICYSLVIVMLIIWEAIYASHVFKKKLESKMTIKQYVLLNCLSSIIAFVSLSYFLFNGQPFNCFFEYSKVISNIFLYMSFSFIFLVAYIEKNVYDITSSDSILTIS